MSPIFPNHMTKIVATIGPASESPDMLERMIRAGMSVARLNFSHGDFATHGAVIRRIRAAERATGRKVAIMADLPGPKIRLGTIAPEPVELKTGAAFILTADDVVGDERRVSTSFEALPETVKPGDRLFLNDGLVQLLVEAVAGREVHCRVAVGGELRSRKGINLPGIKLGVGAFTERDRACLSFALHNGVDAIGQSFVESAADIEAVRSAAETLGKRPFVVAKIERAGALAHLDEILAAADGIMAARGDLGVEVPIEEIAVTQKTMIAKANLAAKPVIVATQMLESMVASRLPTRAEATDAANAILDGADGVMLSGESATGRFPEEAVGMLARIAAYTEAHRPPADRRAIRELCARDPVDSSAEAMSAVAERALDAWPSCAVFVPTFSGATVRLLSRFKPTAWIVAACAEDRVVRNLLFSYGVHPIEVEQTPGDWAAFASDWIKAAFPSAAGGILVAGPSARDARANYRIELLRF